MIALPDDDKRIDFRIPVDFLLNKYVKGRPHLCRASDLSRCGMKVHNVFEPKNGEQEVGLQFQLPGSERVITCAGRVVHDKNDESANGVRITSIAPEHQAMLDEYILKSLDWSTLV